jgi:hypothetical protein
VTDTVGNVPSVGAALSPTAATPAPPVIELVQQPPNALLLASLLTATVVGRGGNGALLLRTDYGTLALNTALALTPGSNVDLRIQPGPPATVVLLNVDESMARAAATPTTSTTATTAATATTTTATTLEATVDETPPALLALGSDIEATIIAAPTTDAANAALAIGTRLLLRIAVPEGDPLPPTPDGPLPVEFAGTVAASGGDGQDKTALETALGRVLLDQRLALPEGTALTLTRLATIAPSTDPAALDIGMTVEARVLSSAPSAAESSFPAGTVLTLRVATLSAALATAPDMTGTIIAGASSETVIDTPIGTLALDRRLALPAGTSLALEQLAMTPPDQPGDLPLAQRAGWSALDQALSVLDRAAPELAARLRTDLAPASGQQLAGTLLFLMSALNTGAWPGAKALTTLDASGRRDLRARLDGDVEELRQLAEPKSGDWRLFVLPLLDRGAVAPVKLYMRRRALGAAPAEQGTRFVLDIDMSRLGNVQLDGLVRPERLNLVMRSHRAITADLRQGIAEVFRNALTAAGLAGDITFTTASRFALTPAATIHGHIGVRA